MSDSRATVEGPVSTAVPPPWPAEPPGPHSYGGPARPAGARTSPAWTRRRPAGAAGAFPPAGPLPPSGGRGRRSAGPPVRAPPRRRVPPPVRRGHWRGPARRPPRRGVARAGGRRRARGPAPPRSSAPARPGSRAAARYQPGPTTGRRGAGHSHRTPARTRARPYATSASSRSPGIHHRQALGDLQLATQPHVLLRGQPLELTGTGPVIRHQTRPGRADGRPEPLIVGGQLQL